LQAPLSPSSCDKTNLFVKIVFALDMIWYLFENVENVLVFLVKFNGILEHLEKKNLNMIERFSFILWRFIEILFFKSMVKTI